jgi:hypothetical protein
MNNKSSSFVPIGVFSYLAVSLRSAKLLGSPSVTRLVRAPAPSHFGNLDAHS